MLLDITGISCTDMPRMNGGDVADCYAVVQVQSKKGNTPTIWNVASPSWVSRECPKLKVLVPAGDGTNLAAGLPVTVCIWDKNTAGTDALIGKVEMKLDGAAGKKINIPMVDCRSHARRTSSNTLKSFQTQSKSKTWSNAQRNTAPVGTVTMQWSLYDPDAMRRTSSLFSFKKKKGKSSNKKPIRHSLADQPPTTTSAPPPPPLAGDTIKGSSTPSAPVHPGKVMSAIPESTAADTIVAIPESNASDSEAPLPAEALEGLV